MERAKLIVKNFGPLKDIEIEVREMVTFIGAQASGKSTLAKLLSIFEDDNFRKDDSVSFIDELKKYNIHSYLNPTTYISFDNINYLEKSPFNLKYEDGLFTKATAQRFLSVIKAFKNKQKENLQQSIKVSVGGDLFDCYSYNDKLFTNFFFNESQKNKFTSSFKKEKITSITFIEIVLNALDKDQTVENYIDLLEKCIEFFPLFYLSDSLYIPAERNFLHLIAENTLGLINNNVQIPKHLLNSGQDYEKAIQTIKELPLTIIDKKLKYKREGKSSYIYHAENEKVDLLESASGLQSIIPILLLVEYSKSLKDEYNFNFVVEEPELNLYPKAQHELIKYLVKNCLLDRKNLILTTHSPFVLASINNLLLAYDKGLIKPKEVNKIIKKDSWLNPKNFIAYQLKNGKAYKIMDDKLGQIKENMIDTISDDFSNEFDKLLDL